jgi:isopenicillin-N N-acyltransferase-like protein
MTPLLDRLRPALLPLLCLTVVTAPVLAEGPVYPEKRHGRGELRYVDGIPVAILQGSPEEIGTQHAALVLKPGEALLDFPKTFVAARGQEDYWPMVVEASKTLWKQSPPRYRQELAALVEGEPSHAEAVNVANTLLELRRLGCSTLIVEPQQSATGGPLFGRNFDFPALGVLDRFSLVTVVRPTGRHAFAAVTFPALVGLFSGMNDAGLAVATLDVNESADGSSQFDATGVPLALVFRQILEECETVDQAERLLKSVKATTWMNLAVCDRNGGAVFEITPQNIVRREATGGILPCTNHFRSPTLAVDQRCWRYEKLSAPPAKLPLDVAAVHASLHQANQGALTLQTMVFEPRELALHLSLGPPPASAQPLQRLDLKPLFLGDSFSSSESSGGHGKLRKD